MKKLILAVCVCVTMSVFPERVRIDSIEAAIYTLEGIEIITHSDVNRPSLHGQQRSVDDMVFESLVYLDAEKHKVVPDDDAVDRYLATIMEDNNLNQEQMEAVFMESGRTLQEGREELKRMQTLNTMLDFKVRGNLIVPRKEVEAYHREHPERVPAQYTLQYVMLPYDETMTQSEQKKAIVAAMKKGYLPEFGAPFTISENDIAADKSFLTRLREGQISQPRSDESGFSIYKLVKSEPGHERSLEDRYREIVHILMQPKYMEMMKKYRKQLFDNASIVYF